MAKIRVINAAEKFCGKKGEIYEVVEDDVVKVYAIVGWRKDAVLIGSYAEEVIA